LFPAKYKIANLEYLTLYAYIEGSQLTAIKIGDKVSVLIDESDNKLSRLEGTVTWIRNEAEFTPKIIQTREDRVNLVYALKILVKNDGRLKIGMPGEIKLLGDNESD
jgi:HlyD family secretion protein